MPLIQCHVSTSLSPERKQSLIRNIVEATTRTLRADPRTVTVIIHEHDESSMRKLGFTPESSATPIEARVS
jgi:4-oxalocrotonate tautomerase